MTNEEVKEMYAEALMKKQQIEEEYEAVKKKHKSDLLAVSLCGAAVSAALYVLGKRIGVKTVYKKLNILEGKETVYTTFEKINDGGVRVNFVDKAGKSCMINNVGFFTKDDFGKFLGYLMGAGIKGFDCDVITASTLSKKVNFLDSSSK